MPPRLIRPKDEPSTSDGGDSTSEPKSGKRRAVSSACIPCRKRKSKCDGQLPSCSTCVAVYRTECCYDADSDHRRKGALKRDIQTLQQRNDALDIIVASLQSLPESESIALLHNIRTDTNFDTIAASLRTNVKLPHNYAPQTLEADFAQHVAPSPSRSNFGNVSTDSLLRRDGSSERSDSSLQRYSPDETPGSWFSTPQDPEFVEHLLSLYFCWVHPFYHLFSRDHFLHDMGRGRTDFCSALLVNAVMAIACTYSDRPLARTILQDSATAGDRFYTEAKRLLEANETASVPTVQALGLMSIYESSKGRDSNGYQLCGRCVRMALELGLHLSVAGSGLRPDQLEVRKITFWAVFNLETACAVSFGRLSQLPRSAADVEKPTINDQTESQTWRPYEDTNLSMSPSSEQPARSMLFITHLSELSELASDMVNTFYAPRERFTSRRLAATYTQYKEWYANLPDVFRLENTTLPHVIILHMYYHACVLHLFRPYIKLDLRGANLYPRDTCTWAANEISSLMGALRAMYGLRRVSLAVTGMLLSAGTIHLLNLPSEPASSHLSQGLNDFQSMSTNHQFAARCVEIIRALANKWNISLPDGAANANFRGTNLRHWPSPPSSGFFAASISRKQSSGSADRSNESSASQHVSPFAAPTANQGISERLFTGASAPTDGLGQTAFWTPFPMQGMPLNAHELISSTSMDFTALGGQQSWPLEAVSAQTHGGYHPRHGSAPDRSQDHMEDAMAVDGTFASWNWQ